MKQQVLEYIENTNNPRCNFNLAHEYEKKGQYAAAFSYYLRTAELCIKNRMLSSEALLRCSLCLKIQGGRSEKEYDLILHAIANNPHCSEAHYMKCIYHVEHNKWTECLQSTTIALELLHDMDPKLQVSIGYRGKVDFLYLEALSMYRKGKYMESKQKCIKLKREYDINEYGFTEIDTILTNKKSLYDEIKTEPLRMGINSAWGSTCINNFNIPSCITKNYSEAYQDIFVLCILNGKHNGNYLDIGCDSNYSGTNTFLLEDKFSWQGITYGNVDTGYVHNRKNAYVYVNTHSIDEMNNIFVGVPDTIDYLNITSDEPLKSYNILQSIPFSKNKFSVITHEHLHCDDETGNYRNMSRSFLSNHGYILVRGNISMGRLGSYCDWWIHKSIECYLNPGIISNRDCVINGEMFVRGIEVY